MGRLLLILFPCCSSIPQSSCGFLPVPTGVFYSLVRIVVAAFVDGYVNFKRFDTWTHWQQHAVSAKASH